MEADPHVTTAASSKSLPFRVGHGFDLHRLEPGYPLIIGGINIPHERGCEAHSDGNIIAATTTISLQLSTALTFFFFLRAYFMFKDEFITLILQ